MSSDSKSRPCSCPCSCPPSRLRSLFCLVSNYLPLARPLQVRHCSAAWPLGSRPVTFPACLGLFRPILCKKSLNHLHGKVFSDALNRKRSRRASRLRSRKVQFHADRLQEGWMGAGGIKNMQANMLPIDQYRVHISCEM